MHTKKLFNYTLVGVVSTLLLTGLAQAEGRQASGYLQGSDGNVIRGSLGDCIHTSTWKPENATIVGCDGVTLDVKVEMIEGEGTGIVVEVVMPSTAMFAFDSADLTAEGIQSLEKYRETLMPELAEAYAAIIIGHTDNTGDAKYNQGLSQRRAESVRDYLVKTGAPAEKLRVVGRGEDAPIASNNTPEGQATNRRVTVVVIGETRALDAMRFPSVALFPRRSGELTEQGKQVIEENRLLAQDQLKRADYIEIVGHTDDVGDDDYNQELSEQRAQSVYDYLVETGLDANKVVVVGMGEKMPITTNTTDEGRAENRRVEILLLGRER